MASHVLATETDLALSDTWQGNCLAVRCLQCSRCEARIEDARRPVVGRHAVSKRAGLAGIGEDRVSSRLQPLASLQIELEAGIRLADQSQGLQDL